MLAIRKAGGSSARLESKRHLVVLQVAEDSHEITFGVETEKAMSHDLGKVLLRVEGQPKASRAIHDAPAME